MKLPSRRPTRPIQKMQQTFYLRKSLRFAGGLLAVSGIVIGMHAQGLPATQPTSLPGQATAAASETASPPIDAPLHADVIYAEGQLQVRADNSSLNQILRSISRVTGLKVTGGVQEQRVFGNYGPAPLSTILATLLDGTGANILLLGGNPGTPPELVLTSRAGGAEPPGPNSPAYAMYDDRTDLANRVPAPSTPTQTLAHPISAVPMQGGVAISTPTPTSTLRDAAAPGKPLTPEMVEQELLQMQAQQDQMKRQLDQKIQQEQADQKKRLDAAKLQNTTKQTPISPNPPQ